MLAGGDAQIIPIQIMSALFITDPIALGVPKRSRIEADHAKSGTSEPLQENAATGTHSHDDVIDLLPFREMTHGRLDPLHGTEHMWFSIGRLKFSRRGAFNVCLPDRVSRNAPTRPRLVHICLNPRGHNAGVPVMLNLAPAKVLPTETLQQLQVLIVNEIEASFLSGQSVSSLNLLEDAGKVAAFLHKQGIPIVVITLGAQGAMLASDDGAGGTRSIYQAAPKVQVVDTTAAGDCFVGAFTVALTEGQSEEDALRFAVYASALKVTKFGAQSGLPMRAEVDAFLKGNV
jgi:hypothetical protein